MDFALTDEQELLLESVRGFCDRYFTEDVVKGDVRDPQHAPGNRRAYRDAGFGLMGIPEEYGGIPADKGYPRPHDQKSCIAAAVACTSSIRTLFLCSTSWSSAPSSRSRML